MATEKKTTKKKSTKKTSKSKVTDLVSANLHAKYRPRVLDDFIGQTTEVNKIKGWFKAGRIPSTIMLTGLTGSGKTTLARIISIYANCDSLSACGKCPSCKFAAEMEGRHPDCIELNMGEAGGKEAIGNVIEAAKTRPRFRKRIMLVDESHLITKAGESSMLVPTEEPPEHTIWIFCTSEPDKMNQTLRNRAAQLAIKAIPPKTMVPRLMEIAQSEGLKFKTDKAEKSATKACKLIAEHSEGQMRFAISKLDGVISQVMAGKKFTDKLVLEDYAASGEANLDEQTIQLLVSIVGNDLPSALAAMRTADNARGVLHKTRFLISGVIGEILKTNKWRTPPVKKFMTLKKKLNLVTLIYAQNALIEAELKMNSTSVPEAVIMETEIGKLIAHDYFSKDK